MTASWRALRISRQTKRTGRRPIFTTENGRADEWHNGWRLLISAAVAAGIGSFQVQAIGATMKTLVHDFGWTRSQITTGPFIISSMGVVMSPLVGLLVDKFGARRVGLSSPWLFALTLVLVGQTGPAIWTWYAAFFVASLIAPAVSPVVWSTPIVRTFNCYRGLALGIVAAGYAVLGSFVPVFMTWAIPNIGWRLAYVVLAAGAVVITVPLLWAWFRDPAQDGAFLKPSDGNMAGDISNESAELGAGFWAAARDNRLWRLFVIVMIGGLVGGFFMVHMQPMLTDAGMSPTQASLVAASFGPSIIVARLAAGYLLDRMFAPHLLAGIFMLPLAGCVILIALPLTPSVAYASAILVGLSLGGEGDALPFLVSRYFGSRSFSSIYGLLTAGAFLGFGAGPLLGAEIFDITGSYAAMIAFGAIALGVASGIVLTLGRYGYPA